MDAEEMEKAAERNNFLMALVIAIEGRRGEWRARGVDMPEVGGRVFYKIEQQTLVLEGPPEMHRPPKLYVLVGPLSPDGYVHGFGLVPLCVEGMGVEHAMVLIENAVDQVASR